MPQPGFDVLALEPRLLLLLLLQLQVVELAAQHPHGRLAVLELAALVLAGDHDAGGHVGQAHRGGVLLHVLAARAAGPVDVHPHVFGLDLDLDVVIQDGQHLDQRKRGVAPGEESNGLMRTSRCTPRSDFR